ncbi:MAG: hypothetical protein ACYCOX_17730 [Acidobacteriaceae bacterium]
MTKKVNMPFTTITRPEPGEPNDPYGLVGATTSLLMMPQPCPAFVVRESLTAGVFVMLQTTALP